MRRGAGFSMCGMLPGGGAGYNSIMNIARKIVVAAVAMAFVCTAAFAAGGKKKVVHFYTIYGWGKYTDSQFLSMFKKTFTEIAHGIGMEADFKHFEDAGKFYATVKKPGMNVVQVGNREELVEVITKYGYEPVMSYKFMGKKGTETCLYARRDGKAEKVEDLKGGRVVMADSAFDYVMLRRLLGGEAPEKYFSSVDAKGDSDAPVYRFYLKAGDAVFTTSQQVEFVKMNNPQVVKGLRKVECSETYPMLPLLVSKGTPREVVDAMLNMGSGKIKGLEEFRAFINYYKAGAVEVSAEDYKWTVDVFTKAVKDGWINDFRKIPGRGK